MGLSEWSPILLCASLCLIFSMILPDRLMIASHFMDEDTQEYKINKGQGYLTLRNVRCSFNHFLRTSEATSTTLQRCPYEVLRSYFIFDLSFSSFLLVIYSKTISTNPPFLVMSPNAPLELHQQPAKWINRWLGLVLNGLSNVASLLLENTFQCWTGNNV